MSEVQINIAIDLCKGDGADLYGLKSLQQIAPNIYVIKTTEELPITCAGDELPLSSIQQHVERQIMKLSPTGIRAYI